jgi:ribosomal protein L11 methyltransferase
MPETTWLEVSVTVDGEMAEAVADVLTRYIPSGVAIESTAVTANPDDSEGHAVGPLRVSGYLRMDENLEETRRRVEEGLWYLGRIRPLPPAQFRVVQDKDWAEAWKQHYHPIAIGEKLMIVPAWLEAPGPDRISIRIDPGMAFGTGTHPTTQLCLELVEQWTRAGQAVIDVGCGSGILSVAALKLGASHALAVDIDADAVEATIENAAANEVSSRVEAEKGSLSEILAGRFSIRQAPLVLANILAPVLVRLLDEGLGQLVSPGGALVLSGILDEQAGDVEAAFKKVGLRPAGRRQINDWVALVAARE